MQFILTDEIKKLSMSERILLVEEIWDSIAKENSGFELSDEQKAILDVRSQSFKDNPKQGKTWEQIKSEYFPK